MKLHPNQGNSVGEVFSSIKLAAPAASGRAEDKEETCVVGRFGEFNEHGGACEDCPDELWQGCYIAEEDAKVKGHRWGK
jgi:hypothetical protein